MKRSVNETRVTGMISRLAGESPDMALGRREHIDEGKGARRNSRLLPEEGSTVDVEPMKDLKEAGVQICHLSSVSEPLVGNCGVFQESCRLKFKIMPPCFHLPLSFGFPGLDELPLPGPSS